MTVKTMALSGVLALAFCAIGATSVLAQDEHGGACVAIGVELGDRSAAAQVELDDAVEAAGDEVSDEDQAQIDELQELLDNLETISASMDVLYDADATPPTEEELEIVHGADINDLLDAAKECVDAA